MGHIPNIDAISGALPTLRIQFEYTQTQVDEGARDAIDNWYMGIIISKTSPVLDDIFYQTCRDAIFQKYQCYIHIS